MHPRSQVDFADRYDGVLRVTQYGSEKNAIPFNLCLFYVDYKITPPKHVSPHAYFLDWKKAFDKVNHGSMIISLQ